MPYNAQQYVDEVKLRLSRYAVNMELDEGSLEMIVNRARRAVQRATMPLFPERYSAILNLTGVPGNTSVAVPEYTVTVVRGATSVTNTMWLLNLPADFVQAEVVLISTAEGARFESRQVTKKELATTMRNVHTQPTPRSPIYCIEKNPNNSQYQIYASKGAAQVTVSDVQIWYLKALKHLQLDDGTGNPDNEVVMSYEFEEFVVYQAMLDALKKTSFNNAKQIIGSEIEMQISSLQQQYNTSVDRSGLLLPSREGIYPNQGIPEMPSNVPQSMMPQQ